MYSPNLEKSAIDRNLPQMYSDEVRKLSVLTREEELRLARLARSGDAKALQGLITGNLRYVQKAAGKFAGYGLPFNDLVQEGNIGLMQAAAKFDPDRGFRLISYAAFYVAAAMRNYALRNWSMVKAGTTNKQRQLFFRIRSELQREVAGNGGNRHKANLALAELFGVPLADIEAMGAHMAGRDFSLNSGETEGRGAANPEDTPRQDWIDVLEATTAAPEQQATENEHRSHIRQCIELVRQGLDARQRVILDMRFCQDEQATLTATGKCIGLSRERVRQLEGEIRSQLENVFLSARAQGMI
jgi:RNA polymerase sigma-32 factor